MEENLEHANFFTGYLRSSGVLKVGTARFVGNFLLGQLSFIFTDKTNFWDCPDTSGYIVNPVLIFHAAHMGCSKAALIISSAR